MEISMFFNINVTYIGVDVEVEVKQGREICVNNSL